MPPIIISTKESTLSVVSMVGVTSDGGLAPTAAIEAEATPCGGTSGAGAVDRGAPVTDAEGGTTSEGRTARRGAKGAATLALLAVRGALWKDLFLLWTLSKFTRRG